MPYLLVFIVLSLLSLSEVNAQSQCTDALKRAQSYYQAGNFNRATQAINNTCLTKHLPTFAAKKAFKIKIESYKYLDYDKEADDLLLEFKQWIRRVDNRNYTDPQIDAIYRSIDIR